MTTFDDERATPILARLAETRPRLQASLVEVGGDPGRVIRAQVAADQAVDLAPSGDGWTATPVELSPGGALTVVGRPAMRLVLRQGASAHEVADAFGVVVDGRGRELAVTPVPPSRPALGSRAWTALVIGMVVVALLVLAGGGLGVFVAVKAVSAVSNKASTSHSSTGAGSGSGSGSSGSAAGTDPAVKLTTGQCFDLGDAYDLGDDVAVKSCTTGHDSEVFATVSVANAASVDDRIVYDEADAACYGHYAGYVGDSFNDSDLDYGVLPPSDEQITAGSTTAVCYVILGGTRSSSVKGSGD